MEYREKEYGETLAETNKRVNEILRKKIKHTKKIVNNPLKFKKTLDIDVPLLPPPMCTYRPKERRIERKKLFDYCITDPFNFLTIQNREIPKNTDLNRVYKNKSNVFNNTSQITERKTFRRLPKCNDIFNLKEHEPECDKIKKSVCTNRKNIVSDSSDVKLTKGSKLKLKDLYAETIEESPKYKKKYCSIFKEGDDFVLKYPVRIAPPKIDKKKKRCYPTKGKETTQNPFRPSIKTYKIKNITHIHNPLKNYVFELVN